MKDKMPSEQTKEVLPLVLDLDGTVVRSDMLLEAMLVFLKKRPWDIFLIIWWMLKGRAFLKHKLANETDIDILSLPLNQALLSYVAEQGERGRPIYVATAANISVAKQVAARLPNIREVIASDDQTNLKGPQKARVLQERFPQGFAYAGDAMADLCVWKVAKAAVVVEAPRQVVSAAQKHTTIEKILPRHSLWKPFIKAIRPHQWAKNGLVFVPLFLAGRLGDAQAIMATILAFWGINLVASATYLVNDLLDLSDDRRHWSKNKRPLASGDLPIRIGIMSVPVILLLGLALSLLAGKSALLIVIAYIAATLAYSFGLKRYPIIDGFTLASLFTLRLGLGIAAAGTVASPWLLVFSMFLFGSLSFAKRHTEVSGVLMRGGEEVRGRGYQTLDLPLILANGVATGICAVLILVLYIIDDAFTQTFYGDITWLWGFPIFLFLFISRIWLMCQRGLMKDDPVAFAIRDRMSLALGGGMVTCFVAAWIGIT